MPHTRFRGGLGIKTIVAIPDLHCPFQHKFAFDFIFDLLHTYSPDIVINQGDELDMHAYSRYEADSDGMGAWTEFEMGVEALSTMYTIKNMKICHSNHTTRPLKKIKTAGVPSKFMKSIKELLGCPKGWEWADKWVIAGTTFIHGEGFSGVRGALTAAECYNTNVVIGHLHSHAGIQYSASFGTQVWGANAGCLIDVEAYAFSYAKYAKHKPVLGAILIKDGTPQFIPLRLSKSGRTYLCLRK